MKDEVRTGALLIICCRTQRRLDPVEDLTLLDLAERGLLQYLQQLGLVGVRDVGPRWWSGRRLWSREAASLT